MTLDTMTGRQAEQIIRDLPTREPKPVLSERQKAWLRQHVPAYRELEARTLRSRGVNVWWDRP